MSVQHLECILWYFIPQVLPVIFPTVELIVSAPQVFLPHNAGMRHREAWHAHKEIYNFLGFYSSVRNQVRKTLYAFCIQNTPFLVKI